MTVHFERRGMFQEAVVTFNTSALVYMDCFGRSGFQKIQLGDILSTFPLTNLEYFNLH